MNELSNQNKQTRKPGMMSSEVASLNQLLTMINDPAVTGAEVPKGVEVKVPQSLRRVPPAAPELSVPPAAEASTPHTSAPGKRASVTRIFFTGLMASGKDYVAEQMGAQIIGLADPLYALANHFFGTAVTATTGKDIPGVRELLQTLGQWGRGAVSARYPLTPARALMLEHVRGLGRAELLGHLCVDWASFGLHKDIWLDSLIERAAKLDASRRVACPNARFSNEVARLQADGWTHFHIMCSAATRTERLRKQNLSPAILLDESEKLAIFLDADALHKAAKPGGKLRCVWNDSAPSPSRRFYDVAEFLRSLEAS